MSNNFTDAAKEFLKPYEHAFNYQNMLQAHLDISRFYPWVAQTDQFHEIKGANVLCSGCGSAGELYAFMDSGATSAFGIEVNYDLANLAKCRFEDSQFFKRVCISFYDGNVLPFESNRFDIIFSAHVIEHTSNPSKYLEELFRVLKPQGIIFIDLPNRFHSLEQHTLIKYIHYLPLEKRDKFIRLLLSHYKFSEDMRFRLGNLINFHFPSAVEIMDVYNHNKGKYHLHLLTAYFHSYGEEKILFKYHPLMYFIGKPRQMNAFRIVISKEK